MKRRPLRAEPDSCVGVAPGLPLPRQAHAPLGRCAGTRGVGRCPHQPRVDGRTSPLPRVTQLTADTAAERSSPPPMVILDLSFPTPAPHGRHAAQSPHIRGFHDVVRAASKGPDLSDQREACHDGVVQMGRPLLERYVASSERTGGRLLRGANCMDQIMWHPKPSRARHASSRADARKSALAGARARAHVDSHQPFMDTTDPPPQAGMSTEPTMEHGRSRRSTDPTAEQASPGAFCWSSKVPMMIKIVFPNPSGLSPNWCRFGVEANANFCELVPTLC